MKLSKYLKTNYLIILLFIVIIAIIDLMLVSFKTNRQAVIGVSITAIVGFVLYIIYDFNRRKKFYNKLLNDLDLLDKKYLITEMIDKPDFYEGEIFYDALYEIDKSMAEKIKEYSLSIQDFKEYIEMWIHEVKIPIASLILMHHNHGNMPKEYVGQVKKLDNYIDQILYYVRSENFEHDFVISEVPLDKVLKNVNLKNKDDYLENDIHLSVSNVRHSVFSDAKWLEFIINQIVSNSIKYVRSDVSSVIKFTVSKTKTQTSLHIYDNGIGIPLNDIHRVFEKTFTGENGRKRGKSTGMGLYIVKRLCEKLGHKITLSSVVNQYTEVVLTFALNDFYKMKD